MEKNINVNDKVDINMECEIKLTVNVHNFENKVIRTFHGVNRIVINKVTNQIIIESKSFKQTTFVKDDSNNRVEIYMAREATNQFEYLTNL